MPGWIRAPVTSGSLGNKPRSRSADQDSASPGNALFVLFGNVSVLGVVQHSREREARLR